ncbi:MAG: hypothetical protein J5710_10835 [Treponema sp.]|nr:hypothetical protein [Treponema sp.]
MKKILLFIAVFTALLMSCTTTKPLKAEQLDSNVFTVNRIVLTSNTIEPSDEELIEIFQSLPYADICDLVEEKTGIYLDTSLIENDEIAGNIEYTVVCDADTEEELYELPEWELNFETDEDTDQFCELNFTMDPPNGYLTAKAIMHTTQTIPATKEGKEDKIVNLQTSVSQTFDKWTFKNIFVDPRSCALIKFHKNIEPTFVENELYSVYKVLNIQDDGYLAVNIKDPIEIRCNINDPGNMFFSPAEIYNAKLYTIFMPGKRYTIKYKLKRVSPDSTKWIVKFKVKEDKPKQSK